MTALSKSSRGNRACRQVGEGFPPAGCAGRGAPGLPWERLATATLHLSWQISSKSRIFRKRLTGNLHAKEFLSVYGTRSAQRSRGDGNISFSGDIQYQNVQRESPLAWRGKKISQRCKFCWFLLTRVVFADRTPQRGAVLNAASEESCMWFSPLSSLSSVFCQGTICTASKPWSRNRTWTEEEKLAVLLVGLSSLNS